MLRFCKSAPVEAAEEIRGTQVQGKAAAEEQPSVVQKPESEQPYVSESVRTANNPPVSAEEAIAILKEGNSRFMAGEMPRLVEDSKRHALADFGQLPMAAIVGCADSRCPLEIAFDAHPGDLFVLRNAGNTVTHAEGSIVASLEYCIGHLNTKLIVVVGHTKCGAIKGAVASLRQPSSDEHSTKKTTTVLEDYLVALGPVAQQSKNELPAEATDDEVAAHAVKVNVFHTMELILQYSEPLRNSVKRGGVQVHGAIYDIRSGAVEFLGQHPRLPLILGATTTLNLRKMKIEDSGAA